MQSVFSVNHFQFPYENLKFPGQHSEEKILFITREGPLMIKLKSVFLIIFFAFGLIFGSILLNSSQLFGFQFKSLLAPFQLFWLISFIFTFWWATQVFRKSVFIITTRRLTKFIYTTPWTSCQMSLGLDKIVDTGSYKKGFFQMITGYGYFVARSAAGAIKNFKIINISFAQDLHNYVNKLLFVFNDQHQELDKFRPFIPGLKGEARDEFVRRTAPQYAKPK